MAVTTAQEIVVLRVPSYSGDSRLDDLQTLAEGQTGTVFGDNYNLAVALLMLHIMALDDSRGSTPGSGASVGSVKGKKEGDLSITYSDLPSSIRERDAWLSQTTYGLELMQLRKMSIFNPRNRALGAEDGSTILFGVR